MPQRRTITLNSKFKPYNILYVNRCYETPSRIHPKRYIITALAFVLTLCLIGCAGRVFAPYGTIPSDVYQISSTPPGATFAIYDNKKRVVRYPEYAEYTLYDEREKQPVRSDMDYKLRGEYSTYQNTNQFSSNIERAANSYDALAIGKAGNFVIRDYFSNMSAYLRYLKSPLRLYDTNNHDAPILVEPTKDTVNITPRAIYRNNYSNVTISMTGYPTQNLPLTNLTHVDFTQVTPSNTPSQGIESVISSAIAQAISRVQNNSTIAVLPISTSDEILRDYILGESEYLLVNQGFKVVDRARLDIIRKELRFQRSDEIDNQTAVYMGRIAGANYMMMGQIDSDGKLRLRVLEVQSAEVVGVSSVSFGDSHPSSMTSFEEAMQLVIQQATKNIPSTARLAIIEVSLVTKFATSDISSKVFLEEDQELAELQHEISEIQTELYAIYGEHYNITKNSRIYELYAKTGNQIALNNISAYLASESEYLLFNQGFKVVDRSQLDRIRDELRFQQSGIVDARTAAQIGKLAGADYLITIQADGQGGLTRLRWRVLDTQTAVVSGIASVPYHHNAFANYGVVSPYTVITNRNQVPTQIKKAEIGFSTVEIARAITSAIEQVTLRIGKDSRLAVVQVSNTDKATGDFVLNDLEDKLVNQGYRLVNRSEIDRIRTEQRYQQTGEVDDRTAVDIGKLAGARYIMTGRIDGGGSLRRLRLRILDTQTAEVAGVASVRY